MLRRRIHRFAIASFAVVSLLFSQLVMASYACPQQADAALTAAMAAAATPCDGMDGQQAALCHQHAADPGSTTHAVKLPVLSLPAVVWVLQLPLALDAEQAGAMPHAASMEARPPPGPIFLSTLRLRV